MNLTNYIKPSINVAADPEEIMRRSQELIGVTKTRAVWRYGFLTGSDHAKAYGVSVDCFYWFLSDRNGKILESFQGYALELPERFQKILRK